MAVGTYALTGFALTFHRAYTIVMSVGSYVLTGFPFIVHRVRNIVMGLGSYILTGLSVTFSGSGDFTWTRQAKDSDQDVWTKTPKN
jgi:hypothetical protein